MKKCESCGAEVSDSAVLCPICGGFTEILDKDAANEIIDNNISENSNDAIKDINELLGEDIFENKEAEPEEKTEQILEMKTEEKTEEKTSDEKTDDVKKTEPPVQNVSPQVSPIPSVPKDDKKKKNKKKTPLWLVVLLILLILVCCAVCAITIVRYYTSNGENNSEETISGTQVTDADESSSDDAAVSDDTQDTDGSTDAESSSSEGETYSEDNIADTLKNTLSQNYTDISIIYDEANDMYTANICDPKLTEKILTIQNTSDENNEYDTLTDGLTSDCSSCMNILLSSGYQSGVTLNIINPQDSQTLITVINGNVEYSMIHKAET